MTEALSFPANALCYKVEVGPNGRIELPVPFAPGTRVVLFVVEEATSFDDLAAASQSSLEFWNNAFDDDFWNEI